MSQVAPAVNRKGLRIVRRCGVMEKLCTFGVATATRLHRAHRHPSALYSILNSRGLGFLVFMLTSSLEQTPLQRRAVNHAATALDSMPPTALPQHAENGHVACQRGWNSIGLYVSTPPSMSQQVSCVCVYVCAC